MIGRVMAFLLLCLVAASAQAPPTSTTLTVLPQQPIIGQPVTLTAVVQPLSSTGLVEFTNDFDILGTAQLQNGQAALEHVFTQPGRYKLRAVYAGNSTRATSKSPNTPTRIGFLPLYAFGAGQSYTPPTPQTPTLVDINLDGKADQMESTVTLRFGVEYESEIAFRYGDGSGGYTTVLTDHKSTGVSLIPSRLNGDDIADAYYSTFFRRSSFPGCGAYLSTGISSWSDSTACAAASIRTDLNGDGLDDFVSPGLGVFPPPSVNINRGGSFVAVPLQYPGTLIYTGDWDGDLKADLLVIDGTALKLLVGRGDGTFLPPVPIAVAPAVQGDVSITEANGDGIPDILAFSNNSSTLYLGQGSDTLGGILVTPANVTATPGVPFALNLTAPSTATTLYLSIGSPFNPATGCVIEVNAILRSIRIQQGLTWTAPVTSGSGAITNAFCSVYGSGASISTVGATTIAIVPVALSGTLGSPLKSYLRALSATSDSGYLERGLVALKAAPSIPAPVSVTPSNGSGSNVTFRLLADSQNTDVSVLNLLVNSAISAANGCLIEVNIPAWTIRLVDSSGTTWSSAQIGTPQPLANEQCAPDPANVTIVPQGTGVYIDIPVRFLGTFSGAKNVYALVVAAGASSGWRQLGTWRVPAVNTPVSSPEVLSLVPIAEFGKTATVTATFGNVADSLYLGYVLFLPTPNVVQYTAKGTCLVEYNKISNGVRLINDAGDNWLGPFTGEVIRPGAAVLTNNVCSVDVSKILISKAGNALSETLTVQFSDNAPGGPMGTFLQAFDIYGFYTGMTQFGNWVARFGSDAPPFLVSGSSISGGNYSSIAARATFTPTNLTSVNILIGSSISDTAPCHIVYVPGANSPMLPIYLINDSGTALVTAVGNIVSNSRCSVDLAMSSASVSTAPVAVVDVNAAVRFSPIFKGPKNIYSAGFDDTGKTTHWVLNGTFTAQ